MYKPREYEKAHKRAYRERHQKSQKIVYIVNALNTISAYSVVHIGAHNYYR